MVSLIGSGLTSFALGISVYQRTGSVTQFALISVFIMLPGIVISPVAGAIVDRYDRRKMMILSDMASGSATLCVALLLFTSSLALWEVYALVSMASLANAFRLPSYMALSSQMVPLEFMGRVGGMMQFSSATAQMISPILAAGLIGLIGLPGIISIDVATFFIAILVLLKVRFPSLPPAAAEKERRSLLRESGEGWHYIVERPGLLGLLAFFSLINLTFAFFEVLLPPMVLAFANSKMLAAIMSAGGVGYLAGSILMTAWGGPKLRIRWLLIYSFFYGAALIANGLRPSALLITCSLFVVAFTIPLISACSHAVWQSKTERHIQGRVFSTRTVAAWASIPLSYFLAGRLADMFFEPLMTEHGHLAGTWIGAIGTGRGRGIALLIILNGILSILVSGTCSLNSRFRNVERELPDIA